MPEVSYVNLDIQQKTIVDSEDNYVLAIARAGAGKSTVLVNRMRRLQEKDPGKGLFISFSRAVAEENNKVRLIDIPDTTASTIHSLSLRLVSNHMGKRYTLINKQSCLSCYRDFFKDFDNTNSNRIIQLYKADVDLPKGNIDIADVNRLVNNSYGTLKINPFKILELVIKLRHYRYENGLILVGEIIHEAAKLPATAWKNLGIKHLAIDEAQDIASEQFDCIRPLIEQSTTCTVVLDPAQEIYGWAGSDVKVLIKELDNIKEFKTYNLQFNYRSNKRIINLGNRVLEGMTIPVGMVCTKSDEGLVKNIDIHVFKHLINQLNSSPESLANTAVLYRSKSCLPQLVTALEGIEYRLNKTNSPMNLNVVFDLYRLLFFSNPPKYVWNSIISFTKAIGYRSAEYVWDTSQGHPLCQVEIPDEPMLDLLYRNLCRNLLALRNALGQCTPERGLELVLDFLGREKIGEEALSHLDVYRSRFREAKTLDEAISLVTTDEIELPKDKLVVSTIHKSKGLEYNTVFLWIPYLSGKKSDEEARVEYVGLTRAKHSLYLVGYSKGSLVYECS